MGEEETKSHAFSLLNGNYTATGNWYSSIVVNGNKGVLKEPTNSKLKMKIKLGDFGEADPEIYKTTGQKSYNIEFLYSFGKDYTELGVVSEDGLKITTKGMMGVTVLEWMTDKEAEALEEDVEGDPIKAPPGPYTIQPDNLGKFLWITGAPGLGKSTSAQLLSKNYGYVYYEGDCFGKCRNPYISSDVTNATMAVLSQKPLKGEGLDARMEQCKKAVGMFMGILNGKEFDLEVAKEFYSCMCDDIISERKRIGGDWVIADAAFTRNLRYHIRSRLGPDLIFVLLNMDKEEVRKRVNDRHHGEEQAADIMEPFSKLCDPIGDDEENAVSVTITTDMSREDVLEKILEMVE